MDALDDLVTRYAAPAFTGAGFAAARGRRFRIGPPPGNCVLVQFRPYKYDPGVVAFYLEWGIVPAASLAFHAEGKARPPAPSVNWGVFYQRVEVPDEIAEPFNRGARTLWTFPVPQGPERCGAALVRLLTEGGLLSYWLDLQDRGHVMARTDAGQLRSDLPAAVPRGRLWRYVAMYVDDGDLAELDAALRELEITHPDNPWVTWWRGRLDRRSALPDAERPPG